VDPDRPGRLLQMFGVFFLLIGLVLMLAGKLPWIGKLPGDIVVQRGNVRLYIPLATSFLLSLVLSLLLRWFKS
jgi:hypothetical protein